MNLGSGGAAEGDTMEDLDKKGFLQTIIDGIPDAIMVIDRDYHLVLTNRTARSAHGGDDPVARKLTCYQFSHGRDTPCEGGSDPCPLALVKAAGRPQRVIHTHLDAKGNRSIVELHSAPVFDDDGEVSCVIESSRDITDRVKSEESRALLAKAIEQAAEMVIITAVDGTIEYASPAVERITGYPLNSLLGQTPRVFKSGKHEPAFYEEMWRVIQSGNTWSGRVVNRRSDGSSYLASLTVTPVCGSQGEISNYVGVSRDVTREVELQAQVEQSRKLEAVGRLAAGLAHEINTPAQFIGDNVHFLNGAVGDLHRLVEDLQQLVARKSGDAQAGLDIQRLARQAMERADFEYLREALPKSFSDTLEGIKRISDLVGAIKEFGHPGSREKQPADINQAIRNTIAVARNEYKRTARIVTLCGELPPVTCFVSDLKQVFLNLIVNAAHAIESQRRGDGAGTIEISTKVDGKAIVVSVRDDGPGIPNEIRDRIFDPFFTTKEIGKGTGQGLAIARSIVTEKHNGSLTVETEVGRGSIFHVTLPIGD